MVNVARGTNLALDTTAVRWIAPGGTRSVYGGVAASEEKEAGRAAGSRAAARCTAHGRPEGAGPAARPDEARGAVRRVRPGDPRVARRPRAPRGVRPDRAILGRRGLLPGEHRLQPPDQAGGVHPVRADAHAVRVRTDRARLRGSPRRPDPDLSLIH